MASPLALGRLPRTPTVSSSSEEKGRFALFMMLLFKPWRGYEEVDFLDRVLNRGAMRRTESEMWDLLSEAYTSWRARMKVVATEVRRGQGEKPAFDTPEWWDAVSYPCVRDLELACSRHTRGGDDKPADLELLALARGGTDPCAVPGDDENAEYAVEECHADGVWRTCSDEADVTETADLSLIHI